MNDKIFSSDFDQKITVFIKIAVEQVLVNLNLQIRQQTQAVSLTSTLLTVSQSVFKIEKIEYFHSDLDKSYDKNDVIFSEKNTLIQNVHFFCDWIWNVVELQEADIVKISLSECFWEIALQWYMHELSFRLKLEIRHDDDVKIWCDKLIKYFKMNFSAVFDKLYTVKYIINNAWNQHELIDHVQAII